MSILAAWGTPENIAAAPWTVSNGGTFPGTTIRNPFGEVGTGVTGLFNTSGLLGRADRAVTIPAPRVVVAVCVLANDSVRSGIGLSNTGATAGATLQIDLNTTTGLATVQQEVALGGVTVRGAAVSLGLEPTVNKQWQLIVGEWSGLPVGAGTLSLFPRLTVLTPNVSTYFYLRPMWTHGWPMDNALAYPVARAGSEQRRSLAGVRDTWVTGTDEMLTGQIRYVPRLFAPDPACSGFEGDGTDLIGLGLRALLRAGRTAQTIRWVRDRADCTTFTDGDLVAPFTEADVSVEADGTRSLGVQLMSTAAYRGAD